MPPTKSPLGEFEHVVLLAVLRCGEAAFGLTVRREIERATGRSVSRGAFYTTLERLETKGLVEWSLAEGDASRGGLPQRRFRVTPGGLRAVRASRDVYLRLWRGLEKELGEP